MNQPLKNIWINMRLRSYRERGRNHCFEGIWNLDTSLLYIYKKGEAHFRNAIKKYNNSLENVIHTACSLLFGNTIEYSWIEKGSWWACLELQWSIKYHSKHPFLVLSFHFLLGKNNEPYSPQFSIIQHYYYSFSSCVHRISVLHITGAIQKVIE